MTAQITINEISATMMNESFCIQPVAIDSREIADNKAMKSNHFSCIFVLYIYQINLHILYTFLL
jgi:hypothetical protein